MTVTESQTLVPEITHPENENGSNCKSDTATPDVEEQAPDLLHVTQQSVRRSTTPDRRISEKISRFSWESSEKSACDSDGDTASETSVSSVGSLGSQSSLDTMHKDNKTKGTKWITTDGEFDLDRSKTCRLSFVEQYNTQDAATNLASEISNAIKKDFTLKHPQRLKVNLSHSCTTSLEDVAISGNKKKKKVSISELQINLEDDLEICKIVKSCQEKTSKAIGEFFDLNVEFDETTIHRFSSTSHSTAYENADPDGTSGAFSPIVAIHAIGPNLHRPMFLRTKAGSVITHKISLRSGSLCVMSGRSEVRYKRAIPKDFGEEGEQYFIIMVQKKPGDSILDELKKIPIPSGRAIKSTSAQNSAPADKLTDTLDQEEPKTTEITELQDKQVNESTSANNTATSPVFTTPPTVVRRGSMIFESGKPMFKDMPQYESAGGLLLTETVGAAVDRMDDATVTTELMRSGCPLDGSLEDKRRRLQNKICLSLGEMSMSAANMNHSINLLKNASPECDNTTTGLLHGELENLNETFTNSQKCIEDTLKMVVDNIVEMKSEIATVKRDSMATTNNSPNHIASDLIREEEDEIGKSLCATRSQIRSLSNEVNLCSEKIGDLMDALDNMKNDFRSTSEEINEMKENAVDILRRATDDMQTYTTSFFADESRNQIKEIHDIVIEAYRTLPDDGIDQQEHAVDSDRFLDHDEEEEDQEDEAEEAETVLENEETPAGDEEEPPERETGQVRSSGFNFPNRLSPTLQKVIRSNQRIDVWLITDSIMRHITEDDMNFGEKYRVSFTRIDRTSTKALAHEKLLQLISAKKPHLIYVHLGINDVQQGEDPMAAVRNLESFDKRVKEISPGTHIILSSPLLNGKSYHTRNIYAIRRSLMLYLHKQEVNSDYRQSRLKIQPNAHFLLDAALDKRRQNPRYFLNNDPLHLSPLGRSAIISTMRDTLYSIFKQKEDQF